MGKSLVIPASLARSEATIPKLELQAASIAAEVLRFVKKHLEKIRKLDKTVMWTDSTDVIDWLRSTAQLPRFVKNRVAKIQEFKVSHVVSEENPADIGSRGMGLAELEIPNCGDMDQAGFPKENHFGPSQSKYLTQRK